MTAAENRARLRKACTERANYRVMVEPLEPWPGNTWQSDCELLVNDIRRHVNGFARVDVVWDVVCKFCGEEWTTALGGEDDPGCCEAAEAEYDKLMEETRDAPKDE